MDGSPKYIPPIPGRELPTAPQLSRLKFGWRVLLFCNFAIGGKQGKPTLLLSFSVIRLAHMFDLYWDFYFIFFVINFLSGRCKGTCIYLSLELKFQCDLEKLIPRSLICEWFLLLFCTSFLAKCDLFYFNNFYVSLGILLHFFNGIVVRWMCYLLWS